MNNSELIAIMGPTASGKTDLACRLVDAIDGEIISVDSAMIYRDMNIGTATPDANTLQRYPHYLVDILDPIERYSVAQFIDDCQCAIADIRQRGKRPVLVGGTMMYFHCLQQGLASMPAVDPSVAQQLTSRIDNGELSALYEQLQTVDSVLAGRVKPTDKQRIQRGLAVFLTTGKPLSVWQQQMQTSASNESWCNIVLSPADRSILHKRIEQRFVQMLEQGFIDEVVALRARGDLTLDMPSMRCVGYRQVWQYLSNDLSHDEMVEKGVIATRQLAKRQLTWLRRRFDSAHWFDPMVDNAFESVQRLLRA